MESGLKERGEPTPQLFRKQVIKEKIKSRFRVLLTKGAHICQRTTSELKHITSRNLIMHYSPNQKRI